VDHNEAIDANIDGAKSFTKLNGSSTRFFIDLQPTEQKNLAIPVSQHYDSKPTLLSQSKYDIAYHYIRGTMSTEAYQTLLSLYSQAEQVEKLRSKAFEEMQRTNVSILNLQCFA